MRWKPHVRFGGRAEETGRPKGRNRASVRSNHTCASLCIALGAHPKAIQERLGHSSITVTLDRYGHLFPKLDEALTDRLDGLHTEAVSVAGTGHTGGSSVLRTLDARDVDAVR